MAETKPSQQQASSPRVYPLSDSLRPRITKEEILKQVLEGQPLCVVEYRSTKLDLVRYIDKKTGKPETFLKVEHNVEGAISGGPSEAFTVEERQPRDLDDPAKVHIGLVKGQSVALRLATIRREQGRVLASVEGLSGVLVVE